MRRSRRSACGALPVSILAALARCYGWARAGATHSAMPRRPRRAWRALRYLAATGHRSRYRAGLGRILADYDAILTPATPGVAPKGEATGNPAFNSRWSLTGLPSLTLPLLQGEDDMPLGVQLVCAPGDDARLMRVARWLSAEVGAGL